MGLLQLNLSGNSIIIEAARSRDRRVTSINHSYHFLMTLRLRIVKLIIQIHQSTELRSHTMSSTEAIDLLFFYQTIKRSLRLNQSTMVQNSLEMGQQNLHYPMSLGASEWASEQRNKRSGARKQSEQCRASEWVSSASKRASGRANGSVLYASISYTFFPIYTASKDWWIKFKERRLSSLRKAKA